MKKLFKGLLAGLMALSLVACGGTTTEQTMLEKIKEQGYITLATSPDFAPNEFYVLGEDGNNKIVGTDILFAEAIAKKIGVELKISAVAFSEVINEVNSGNADFGLAGFAWTETRAKAVKFTDSYSQTTSEGWQGVMVRKEDANKYKTLEDLKAANLTVAAQTGSIQYEMALKITAEENIKPIADNSISAQELSMGYIDAYIITSDQAQMAMNSFDNITILPEDGFNLDPEDNYSKTGAVLAMTPDYDNETLIEVINEVIAESLVKNDEGKNQFDMWKDDITPLLPYDLTSQIYGY